MIQRKGTLAAEELLTPRIESIQGVLGAVEGGKFQLVGVGGGQNLCRVLACRGYCRMLILMEKDVLTLDGNSTLAPATGALGAAEDDGLARNADMVGSEDEE